MARRKSPGDYEVDCGRPPASSRFKAGQSGNKKGRPKGARGFHASVLQELNQKITISEVGEQKRISKQEAAAKRLVEMA